jgi:hypothetical protein
VAVTDLLATLAEHGMLLESARGPLPNVAQLVAGEPIKGSWWGHPRGHEIFGVINELADSPDVVRLRLVRKKVTLVHRRLWPALSRLEHRLGSDALAAVVEEHTESGAHRVVSVPFAEWLPADARRAGTSLSESEALGLLPEAVRASIDKGSTG